MAGLDPSLLALAGLVFLGYTVQTVTGFGAVVITLTFAAHFLPIPLVLPLIVPLSIAQCAYLAIRHHGAIDRRLLLVHILPIMGAGTGVGIFIAPHLEGDWLRIGFAVLVLLLSARELVALTRAGRAPRQALGRVPFVALLAGAGVVHGIYATGGPMLVYAVNRAGLTKAAFRSTLVVVWIALNTVLTVSFVRAGAYDAGSVQTIGLLVPAVVIGLVAGELIHHRVEERRFRIVTFALLCAAALSLLAR